MTGLSEDVEEMKEILIDSTDEFVYENQTVLPEDMYFIAELVEEYYNSKSANEFGNEEACDIAWVFAREIAGIVEENDDFNWLNAYFVTNGLYESVRQDYLEFDSWSRNVNQPVEHFSEFGFDSERIEHTESVDGFETTLNEIQKILELYVNLSAQPSGSIDELDKPQEISMFVGISKKRYASEFPYDMLESSVSFQLIPLLTELTKDSDIPNRAIYEGIRFVRDWTERRAKREHEMLCVGVN